MSTPIAVRCHVSNGHTSPTPHASCVADCRTMRCATFCNDAISLCGIKQAVVGRIARRDKAGGHMNISTLLAGPLEALRNGNASTSTVFRAPTRQDSEL